MKKTEIEKISKYIKYYNKIKNKEIKSIIYSNEESGAKFSISENEDEVIFSFLNPDNSFKFIRDYTKYRKTVSSSDEREISAITFNEIVDKSDKNNFMVYCANKKLNNPFRSYKQKTILVTKANKNKIEFYSEFVNNKIKYYIHSGFVELYNTIGPELIKQFEYYLNNTNKKIVLIGFSFSSVIAQIAYLVCFLRYISRVDRFECYLYSTPNAGNKYFENFFDKLHRKETDRKLYIVNCDDDCTYNIFSKRFGFRFMKSTLLIKKNKISKRIYSSKDYENEIDKL